MTTTETAARPSCVNDPVPRGFREGSTWEPDEGQPHTAAHSDAAAVPAHDGPDHYPPPVPPCQVDHDALTPRVARYGKALMSHWACPACDYHTTTITARPKKAHMNKPTLADRHSVVQMFAQCKTASQVERAHPHLSPVQIEVIRDDNGGHRLQELRFSEARLAKELAAAGEPATRHEEPARLTQVAPVQQSDTHDGIADLLDRARKSKSKRTVAAAEKIEQLLIDLRARVLDEAKAQREAEKAARLREDALAEVAALEEQLRAARAKAGKATTRSTSSTSGPSKRAVAADGATAKEIRAWAAGVGVDVPKVGAVRADVIEAYEKAHAKAAS